MRNWLLQKTGLAEGVGPETEFLPGALEVVDTPPSPIGRAILWAIAAVLVSGVLWACLGHVDVVAVASGRIIPSDQVKTIQLLEIGVVRHIAVQEGQHVEQGDLLVEMDTTSSKADIDRLTHDLLLARCEAARVQALLQWSPDDEQHPAMPAVSDISHTLASLYDKRVKEEATGLVAQLAGLNNDLMRLEAQHKAAEHRVLKQQETLPIVTKRANALKQLYNADMGSENDWLYREQERIEAVQNLSVEQQRLNEIAAAIQSVAEKRRQVLAEFRRDLLQQESETQARQEQLEKDLIKAQQRNTLQRLTAPVSGVIQQLAVHTVGGVIEEAQPIMVIVPDSYTLEVEAKLLNRDIGFVHDGQPAEIKLEAFPFTEYGVIEGSVKHLSLDAVQDEKLGLVYLARISLDKDRVRVGAKDIRLSPGMNTTTEIKIRKRRLIEYFLSPLMKYTSESLRER